MELIRQKFGFERWMVVGGSWGATLALAYAQAHPERVSGLVLRATFLGTREEIEAGFCDVLPRFYPGLSQDFLGLLPEEERARPLDAYWRRILEPDRRCTARPRAPGTTPSACCPSMRRRAPGSISPRSNPAAPCPRRPSWKRITSSTTASCGRTSCWTTPANSPAFPGVIVQGRFDLLCPPSTSQAVASRWSEADIRIVESAGHTLYDPGVRNAVMKAIADVASKIVR